MTAVTGIQKPANVAARQDIRRRYLRAALYSGVLGGISQALYGMTPMVIARRLGPVDYGVYSVVMSLSAIVIAVFGLGQNSALHKLVPQYYVADRERSGAILADALMVTSGALAVFCAGFFLSSGWIAVHVYRDAALSGVFRICAVLMMTLTLFSLGASAIAGLQDFKSYNLIQVARNLALLVFAWVGVWLAGLTGALAGQVLASALGLALIGYVGAGLLRNRFPKGVRPVFSREILGAIGSFILPTLLMTLLNIPAYWWASTMVARHAGFQQVGLLGVAYTLSQATFLIPMNLYTPAMTFLSEAHAAEQSEIFRAMVTANLRAMWVFSMPLALALALFSPLIIHALFGTAYLMAAPLTLALSLTALLMLLVGLMNTAIIASGRMWHNLMITFGWVTAFGVTGLIVIPRWGAAGCATAFASTYSLYLIGVCMYGHLVLKVKYDGIVRLIALTMLSFGLAAIIFFNLQGVIAYVASAGVLVGLAGVEWFWILGGGEREQLLKGAAKLLATGFPTST
ncbi:MAG: oligosaccharide flippase family protein [Acidobacteria bacterium]|nr:oligosaccharide flippase family protein [Acidobacteriota bacterium]